MNTLNMADAKKLFENNALSKWRIDKDALSEGWVLLIETKQGWATHTDARKNAVRVFKTIDGAVGAIREIGFQVLSLRM